MYIIWLEINWSHCYYVAEATIAANYEVCELLLEAKADLNVRGRNYSSLPLGVAAKQKGRDDLLVLLLDHGANINSKSMNGNKLNAPSF